MSIQRLIVQKLMESRVLCESEFTSDEYHEEGDEINRDENLEESDADVVSKVKRALDDAGIQYRVRGKSSLIVRKQDLRKASEIRNALDPKSIVHVASLA